MYLCTRMTHLRRLHLPASKTDVFRAGVDICYSSTSLDLDPVTVLDLQLALLEQRGLTKPLDPLFPVQDGKAFTRKKFCDMLANALRAAGLDPDLYSSHSFRKGGASALRGAGVPDADIRILGRWAS